jgi:uncharacterized protein (TIGR04551 family)
MRLRTSLYVLLGCSWAAAALAQPAPPPAQPAPVQPAPEAEEPPAGEPEPAEPEPEPEEPPAELEPEPAPLPPQTAVPSPEEMEDKLIEGMPPAPQASEEWTAPSPVFTLHGYMRMRGELMDTFWLGRRELSDFLADPMIPRAQREGQGPDPFSRFRPEERRRVPGTGRAPADLPCVDEERAPDGTCDVDTLQFANMRLRLSPQLNLSEDVRVKMTFDVFDNVVAGSPPASFYGTTAADAGMPARAMAEETLFADTTLPPSGGTGLGDSIKARRAWAEVRNRDLGELRFGRMPQQWGLGMRYNAGDGVDDDLSTDLDRVLGITKIAGFYLSASYDFIAEGFIDPGADNRPLDRSQLDDVDQFTFSLAKRYSDEEMASSLERGELVLNGGVQFTIRNQDAFYDASSAGVMGGTSPLRRLAATTYTTDLWALLRYRGLRVEAEFVWVTGGMDNIVDGRGTYDISQLGYALEGELRLLDEKLGLYFDHGLATGDSDVEGLSSDADFITQLGADHNATVSTFRFHPSYRVDLILWRNIMRQVTGAYYFRPGISYDFIRSQFGQLFGARVDFIWSRASSFVQTWGNDPDLGIELDVSLYFRTEDGPDLDDGYYALLQYGVLFPMRGLSYVHEDTDLNTAQTLRLLLGVMF